VFKTDIDRSRVVKTPKLALEVRPCLLMGCGEYGRIFMVLDINPHPHPQFPAPGLGTDPKPRREEHHLTHPPLHIAPRAHCRALQD